MKAELVLALDVDSASQASYFVNRLYPKIKLFKIGPRLFIAAGPGIIKFIRKKRAGVFLDLKFHDIPNTVAEAVRQAVRLGVRMLTLHISGGSDMLEAAVRACKDEAARLKVKRPFLIGVTVLTSRKTRPGNVLKLARAGLAAGLDGVVCSPREAKLLRSKLGGKFLIITPGIRSMHALKADQKRTATAEEAVKAGSNYLVVGRPILCAERPEEEAAVLVAACRENQS